MPVNVVMPQMGESVAEGTVVRWIKKVGDNVDRDEPLFEISTDKVDAEIPSPAAGTLSAIHVKEGETVPVDTVVALIAQGGEAVASTAAPAAPASSSASAPKSAATKAASTSVASATADAPPAPTPQADGSPAKGTSGASSASNAGASTSRSNAASGGGQSGAHAGPNGYASAGPVSGATPASRAEMTREDLRRQRSSPLVRRIASEHNVDISQISGSGISGRVTKKDILEFIEHRPAAAAQAPGVAARAPHAATTLHIPAYAPGERVEVVPMTVMRKKIAEHMIFSTHTSAHVHSVFEVDYTQVSKIRAAKKDEYERAGTKITFLSFIAKATIDALRAMPVLNSSIDGDSVVYKKDINIGIAVALDWGLIVPVIKHADEKNLLGLSRSVADLATRAREKKLKPEEVQGGTFTITNPGIFGAQFGMPIINQPQVAILGVGAIEKRAVVIDDAIAIRPRGYLTLGYDHRLIDGAVADEFMSMIKKTIETFDPAAA
jgi:pyruvate dehydrogenase E2 component (dihydrolipoamide acetyltransferase)